MPFVQKHIFQKIVCTHSLYYYDPHALYLYECVPYSIYLVYTLDDIIFSHGVCVHVGYIDVSSLTFLAPPTVTHPPQPSSI